MIKFKLLNGNKIAPRCMTEGAAGFDFTLPNDLFINGNSWKLIPLSVACEIPDGCVGILDGRSSLYKRYGLLAITGYIDSDYRGQVYMQVLNNSNDSVMIKAGERIGQMVVVQYVGESQVVEELSDTGRGSGGFGHTGN